MSKPQVVWLIIRLAGVYFAFLTVTSFFGLVGSIPPLFTLPKIDAPASRNSNVTPVGPNTPIMPSMRQMPTGFNPADPSATPSTAAESPNGKADEAITDKFKGESFKAFLYFFFLTLLYAALAWYLLRDGRVLYAVLNREEPDGLASMKDPAVTSLNLSEEKVEKVEE